MFKTPPSLLEKLRQPADRAAWDRFVQLYTPFLYRCTLKLGLQEADRADLLQEVFVVLCRELPAFEYDESKSFRGWLRTIVLNKFRDFLRQRAKLPADGISNLAARVPIPDDLEEFADDEYRQYLVARALELMQSDFQPTTWRACWEHTVEGRPAADVARELGLTPDAVYAANYRVLRRLRQELEGLFS